MASACIADGAALATLVPDLATHTGPELDEIVATTCEMLHADIWGDKLSRAHTYLAAHFATLCFNPGEAMGAITSMGIDKLSTSFAAGTFDDAELGATKYGRIYMMLKASLRTSVPVVRGGAAPDWAPSGKAVI